MKRTRTKQLPLLGITMGDPAGIGPEVVAKALAGTAVRKLARPLVIGSHEVMAETARKLKLSARVVPVKGHDALAFRSREIPVIDPLDAPLGRFQMGVAAAKTGAAAVSHQNWTRGIARAGGQRRSARVLTTAS